MKRMRQPNGIEIIAHRGASHDAPENTVAAFELGIAQGADALECDVRLSRDGALVVIHDATLERTYGDNRGVGEMDQAELIAAGIPLLADVLGLLPPGLRIFIEVKVGLPALPSLKDVLAASALPWEQVVLMEFDLETVVAMKAAFPKATVLWLNDFPLLSPPWSRRRALDGMLETTRKHGLDGMNVQNIPQLDAGIIESCHRNGLGCYCWTVDDPGRAEALFRDGIDGIATNRPGWMRDQLGLPGRAG
jgi:glycerophosphoryl diester phosphodiesterase